MYILILFIVEPVAPVRRYGCFPPPRVCAYVLAAPWGRVHLFVTLQIKVVVSIVKVEFLLCLGLVAHRSSSPVFQGESESLYLT